MRPSFLFFANFRSMLFFCFFFFIAGRPSFSTLRARLKSRAFGQRKKREGILLAKKQFQYSKSVGTLNLIGTQASGAHIDVLGRTVYDSLYTLDVGLIGSVASSVRMRNLDCECNAFAANITLCHIDTSSVFFR